MVKRRSGSARRMAERRPHQPHLVLRLQRCVPKVFPVGLHPAFSFSFSFRFFFFSFFIFYGGFRALGLELPW